MTEELQRSIRATMALAEGIRRRTLDALICPPRFYRVREAALGTASYETLLRSRGPLGPLTRDQAQRAIILAGFAMGVIARDASGNMVRV
jgi:hypothetical protein